MVDRAASRLAHAATIETLHERVFDDTCRISGMGIRGPGQNLRLLFVGEHHREP